MVRLPCYFCREDSCFDKGLVIIALSRILLTIHLTDTILTSAQLSKIRSQIATARSKGIGARYWDTPGWPVRIRNGLWRTFYEEGVALINVDDLEAAAFTEW